MQEMIRDAEDRQQPVKTGSLAPCQAQRGLRHTKSVIARKCGVWANGFN